MVIASGASHLDGAYTLLHCSAQQCVPKPARSAKMLPHVCSNSACTSMLLMQLPSITHLCASTTKQVVTRAAEPTSPLIARGPFIPVSDSPVLNGKRTTVGTARPNNNTNNNSNSTIPRRMRYRHCKTHVAPPSDFDLSLVARSSRLPNAHLTLDCVRGFRGDGRGPNLCAAAHGRVIYTVAAVAVVWSPHNSSSTSTSASSAQGQQSYFLGHTDDISAVSVTRQGIVAVTGQSGRTPCVCVWTVPGCVLLARLGAGFLQRGVSACAVTTVAPTLSEVAASTSTSSSDTLRVAAVGCDDHHMLGVWTVSGKDVTLLCDAPAQNGSPPLVSALQFGHTGSELISVGESGHCKFWTITPAERGVGGKIVKNATLTAKVKN
jgi:HELP motif